MRARHQLLPLGLGSRSLRAWALLALGLGHGQAAAASQLVRPGDATQCLQPGVGQPQLAAAGPAAACAPRSHGWPLSCVVVAAASRDRRGARPAPRPTYPA